MGADSASTKLAAMVRADWGLRLYYPILFYSILSDPNLSYTTLYDTMLYYPMRSSSL